MPTSVGLSKKKESSRKYIYFCCVDYDKDFDCVDHHKLWKILKEMGIPNHLTCLLRNLYAGQEAIVRTGHGKTDRFQIGKGVHQGCILSPCLFNLGFLVAQRLKHLPASACNAGDLGSIPGSGRSPGEENGNPFQYSCLENPMDRGAWWAAVHGVPKSWT